MRSVYALNAGYLGVLGNPRGIGGCCNLKVIFGESRLDPKPEEETVCGKSRVGLFLDDLHSKF